ncbi:MAG: transcriptional regulator NrdR [Gemmatimonadota bacterium]|nr:transcriptional regulator NrdR [Gemmatimonadota bacterium]
MTCPACESGSSKVVDTRAAKGGRAIRRRRECLGCGQRFTTYERVEERAVRVVKSDGSAEDFQRDKLEAGIATACAKRPVSPAEIEALVDRIEDNVSGSASVEISSRVIGEQVMEGLKPLDRVAYVRYASVYRNFQHIDEFQEVVDELTVRDQRETRRRFQRELPLVGGNDMAGEEQ